MGDAICSQIDSYTYDTFIKERHKQIISVIHENGGLVKLHICGNISHLLPAISELGVDLIDIDYQVDLDEAFEQLGPDVIRCGNINPVLIEERGEEEIFSATSALVEREKGRKFILSGGCEITVNTHPDKLAVMRKASLINQ